ANPFWLASVFRYGIAELPITCEKPWFSSTTRKTWSAAGTLDPPPPPPPPPLPPDPPPPPDPPLPDVLPPEPPVPERPPPAQLIRLRLASNSKSMVTTRTKNLDATRAAGVATMLFKSNWRPKAALYFLAFA